MNVMVNNFRNNSYFADTLDSVRMGIHAGIGEYVFSTKGLATGLS